MSDNLAKQAYDRLARGFLLRKDVDSSPIPLTSNRHLDGVVVPVYGEEATAKVRAAELTSGYGIPIRASSVGALWETVSEIARRGFAGIMLDETYPVHLYNRLSEIDRSRPTVGRLDFKPLDAEPQAVSESVFFGVRGCLNVHKAELIPWRDFRLFDRTSCRWMLGEQPLPESIEPWSFFDEYGAIHTPHGATLLGPYVDTMGAVPIFSSRTWAEHFSMALGLECQGTRAADSKGISVQPIQGKLLEFLEQISDRFGGSIDIGLNPFCHRFRQGYFFKVCSEWYLRTIGGVFLMTDGRFIRADNVTPPKGDDVGGRYVPSAMLGSVTSVCPHPLKRLLGANTCTVPAAEAEDIIEQEFAAQVPESFVASQPAINEYAIDGFDKIAGWTLPACFMQDDESWGGPLLFPDIVAATVWLMKNWLENDEEVRTHGAGMCSGIVVRGSNCPDYESRRTRAIQKAVHDLLFDVLTRGYRPEHSIHLQRLFQDGMVVLEITKAGYLADLAYCGLLDTYEQDGDDDDELIFPKTIQSLKARAAQSNPGVEPILRELRSCLGPVLDQMTADSKNILATALQEYRKTGKQPGYDYAGITMKLSKVFERELKGRVFKPWREGVRKQLGKNGLVDLQTECNRYRSDSRSAETGLRALAFIQKRQNIELGAMRYVLVAVRENSSHPVVKLLGRFCEQLSNPSWLISQELEEVLERISNKYRNGGVHEYMVDYETCTEAFEYLVQGDSCMLARLIQSSAPGQKGA